jgi:hypothetical protein
MKYFIYVENTKLDYTTEDWLIGEQSFNNFWPSLGFKKLLKAKDKIDQFKVITDKGKIIDVATFVQIIENLNIKQ